MKYKEILINEVETEEIWGSEPFYNNETDEANDIDFLNDVWSESSSMPIDEALKILTDLKENGAERVYIYAHGDHNNYIFTGVTLKPELENDNNK